MEIKNCYSEGKLWKVLDIERKGLGVVSKEYIPKGTLILVDVPLFIIPNSAHTENPVDLDVVLEENVKQLNEDDRRHFYSLADCKTKDENIKTARGIYFTNCFTIGNYRNSPSAMLPRLSRINHSCSPNTEYHWDEVSGSEHLRSIRDIQEGEELTDCYLDLTLEGRISAEQRKRLLKGGYDFWCQCKACSLSPTDLMEEDKLRMESYDLSQEVNRIDLQLSQPQCVIIKAERLLDIRMKLNFKLVHQLETLEILFQLDMLQDDIIKARNHAEMGKNIAEVRYGFDSHQTLMWTQRALDPVAYVLG